MREADSSLGLPIGVQRECRQPEGGVGEVDAHFRFEQRGRGKASILVVKRFGFGRFKPIKAQRLSVAGQA